ncbi:MAG: hypothetical protein ACREYF_22080 [Gammaproteobacteria bacterium]
MNRTASDVRIVLSQITKYARFVFWFLQDVHAHFRVHIRRILISGLLGLGSQSAALFIVYHYASALERVEQLNVFGVVTPVTESATLLTLVAVVVLSLLIAAFWSTSRARIRAIELGRLYTDYCVRRAVTAVSKIGTSRTDPAKQMDLSYTRLDQLTRRDANFCGIAVRMLTNALLPIGTSIIVGAVLFVVDARLSLIILAILGIISITIYRMNLFAARSRSSLGRKGQDMTRERRRLLDRVVYLAAPIANEDFLLHEIISVGATSKFNQALIDQRRIIERSRFVSQAAMAAACFVILLTYGRSALDHEASWSGLFAYLGLMSMFTANISKSISMLTSINRFYPPLASYAQFMRESLDLKPADQELEPPRRGGHVYFQSRPVPGDGENLMLAAGGRGALLISDRLTRFHVATLSAATASAESCAGGEQTGWWYSCAYGIPVKGGLREIYGFPPGYGESDLRTDINHIGLEEIRSPRLLDALPLKKCLQLSESTAFVLGVLAGYRRGYRALVLEERGLRSLRPEQLNRLLDLLDDSVVLIAYSAGAYERVPAYGEHVVLAASDTEILGWARAEQIKLNPEVIGGMIRKLSASQARHKREYGGVTGELEDAS